MADLISIQTALCFVFVLAVSNEQLTAFANDSCQVYPSEYAYHKNSVHGSEKSSANCIPYGDETHVIIYNYKHCDGTQLQLTDSNLGSEQYSSSDYYVWNTQIAGSSGHQLLFIFQSRVNLTTITLHYYSDNVRGLPRLRFFAVPDHFDVWNATSASYSRVDIAAVSPGGEPAGRRNLNINVANVNFITKKVLLFKYSSSFSFAVSEVEFSTCIEQDYSSTTVTEAMDIKTSKSAEPGSTFSNGFTTTNEGVNSSNTENEDITLQLINHTGTQDEVGDTAPTEKIFIVVGTVVAIVILLILSVMLAIVLFLYLQKSTKKRKGPYDSTYSTLCRESGQQTQSQSLHTFYDVYDQIQLSPSTGQAEFISRNETANTNNPPPHQTEYGIHPSVDKDKPKSAKLKITALTISTQDEDKSTSEQPTYAVVNKKKKQNTENESVNCPSQNTAVVSQNEGATEQNAVEQGNHLQESQDSPDTTTQTIDSPQELYTAVKKKPKDRPAEDEIAPPIPPYTTEELYTAVKKKPKASAAGDEQAPQIPPHTIEELYTAVQKKPKTTTTNYEEQAPPIPAHTVEELYTAVIKKPKVITAEDEEEAPPVPPYTVEEL